MYLRNQWNLTAGEKRLRKKKVYYAKICVNHVRVCPEENGRAYVEVKRSVSY